MSNVIQFKSKKELSKSLSTEEVANKFDLERWIDRLAEIGGHKPQKRTVRRGDVYRLGNHRLMCGDSTSATDVGKLMGEHRAALGWTSPPYLNQRTYCGTRPATGNRIDGKWLVRPDHHTDRSVETDWLGMMKKVFSNLRMEADGQVLVNLGQVIREGKMVRYEAPFIDYMEDEGYRLFDEYIWHKMTGKPFVVQRLMRMHEKVFHFCKVGKHPNKTVEKKPENIVNRKGRTYRMRYPDGSMRAQVEQSESSLATHKQAGSVFEAGCMNDRDRKTFHPAVFPIELCGKIIPIWTDEGDVVYEPFSGSGTNIFACEEIGRRCFAMELQEQYVAETLKLWEQKTGIKAVLVK